MNTYIGFNPRIKHKVTYDPTNILFCNLQFIACLIFMHSNKRFLPVLFPVPAIIPFFLKFRRSKARLISNELNKKKNIIT